MKKYLITLIFSFFFIDLIAQQKHTISGFVVDKETGESLIGVNVIWKDQFQGTTTNAFGFYSITLPEGNVKIDFSYIGFDIYAESISLTEDLTLNIELAPSAQNIQEVIVVGEETVVDRTQSSLVEVPVEQIKTIPAFLGEVDVLKAIQLLPGVQSGGEGTSGFYVRGGGPDQNLILLDGVPVYNASHLFGFFSVFNADAIKNVRLTKGGFPSRFGGRLSSVLEIDMKEGNMKKFQGEGSVGLISSKLSIEGPILKDKTSFIVSARRTYIDILAQPFIRKTNNGNPAGYFFYDINAKINHKISDRDRLDLSLYSGKDRFYLSEDYNSNDQKTTSDDNFSYRDEADFGLEWGNLTSSLRWNHLFSNKLFSNTTLTFTKYQFQTDLTSSTFQRFQNMVSQDSLQFVYYSGIEDVGAKIDFDYIPNPNHYIRFGVNYIYHSFYPGAINLFERNVDIDSLQNQTTTILDTSFVLSERLYNNDSFLFIEDDIKVNDRLKINAGIHLAYFNTNGTAYTDVQPRISSRYIINKDWSVKASYAQMQQHIHLLSNTSVGLPIDIWVPSTDSVPPQKSRQLACSVNHNFKNGLFEISLEGYYKSMDNLISLKPGTDIIDFQDWRDKIEIAGQGRSYGIELFLQKKKGKTTGWFGYTLAFSERQFDNINFGKWYPYKYDRRHDISVVASHKFNDKFDIGMTWVFGTGNNITLETARFPSINLGGNINGITENSINEIEYYPSRNNYRMASYHRLDLGLNFHKQKKWGERTWSIGAYNVYNRKNPFYIRIDNETTIVNNQLVNNKQAKQVSLFPIIPSITYKFKF
ncbi:MAG: TonB-dependent receptor [Bacteroidota bacterium]|nr:TonB-dependent receptor [Bacteroidota bacterium]